MRESRYIYRERESRHFLFIGTNGPQIEASYFHKHSKFPKPQTGYSCFHASSLPHQCFQAPTLTLIFSLPFYIYSAIITMNNLNSLLNHHQNSSLQEIHNQSHFHPSEDDFLDQILSSVPSSAASFPWPDDHPSAFLGHFSDQSTAKMRQNQISTAAAKALMLQQQLLLSAASDLHSPIAPDACLLPMPQGDRNDVVGGRSFQENDASTKALFNGFTELIGQNPNQPLHLHHSHEPQNFRVGSAAAAASAVNQPAASDSGVGGQPRQKVRARRGQATDPHSIAERLRRERIAERMKGLQELVPNANKTDKASMLDEIIDYVKFLQLQVKVLSMSRLGSAAAVAPLLGDTSSQGKSGKGAETSEKEEGMTVAEQQVAKLMEDDMGAAMQYLQGKGLCLMPISLATAISTGSTSCRSRNQLIPPPNNGEASGSPSPSMSGLTIQSTTIG